MKLEDILRMYDQKSLLFYAKDLKIPDMDQYTKDELIIRMADILVQEGYLEKRLSVLDENTYALLQKINRNEKIDEDDHGELEKLLHLELVAFAEEDEVYMVDEVKEIFDQKDSSACWQKRRRQKAWFMKCQQVLVHYWGECDLCRFQVLLSMDDSYTEEIDLQELLSEIPSSEIFTCIDHQKIYWRSLPHSVMANEYRQSQSRYDYYLPSKHEIIQLYENDYDADEKNLCILREYCLQTYTVDEDTLDLYLHDVWNDLSYGLDIKGVYRSFLHRLMLQDDHLIEKMFMNIHQHCRKFIYRGHTSQEIKQAAVNLHC